ncbi:MAG: DUF4097 family beta strand repeat-containing protein [Proteocatella sp.]
MKKFGIVIGILIVILAFISIKIDSNEETSNPADSSKRQIINNETLNDFDKMVLDIGVANVKILEGDTYSISIDMDERIAIKYKVENQTLELTQDSKDNEFDKDNFKNNSGEITITVPNNKEIKVLKTDQGVGNWEIRELTIQDIDMSMGVGDCNLNSIISQNLNIEGGVGRFKAEDMKSGDVTIEAGVGDIEVSGELKGNIDIEGGVGRIALKTSLPEDSYHYELEKGLGGITLNNKDIENEEEKLGKDEAPYNMKISSGVGSIDIETK